VSMEKPVPLQLSLVPLLRRGIFAESRHRPVPCIAFAFCCKDTQRNWADLRTVLFNPPVAVKHASRSGATCFTLRPPGAILNVTSISVYLTKSKQSGQLF